MRLNAEEQKLKLEFKRQRCLYRKHINEVEQLQEIPGAYYQKQHVRFSYKIIRDCKNNISILTSILKNYDTHTTTFRYNREEIFRYHFVYELSEDYTCSNNNTENEYSRPISENELNAMARVIRKKKASGPDRLNVDLSKIMYNTKRNPILNL